MPLELTTTLVKHFPDAIRYEIIIRCALPLTVKRRPDHCQSPAVPDTDRAGRHLTQPVKEIPIKCPRDDSAPGTLPFLDCPLPEVSINAKRELTPISIETANASSKNSASTSPCSTSAILLAAAQHLHENDESIIDLGTTHVNRRNELDSASESGTPWASPTAELLTLSPVDLAKTGQLLSSSTDSYTNYSSLPSSPTFSRGRPHERSKAGSSNNSSLSIVGPYTRSTSNLDALDEKHDIKKPGILPRLRRSLGKVITRRATSDALRISRVVSREALSTLEPNSYQNETIDSSSAATRRKVDSLDSHVSGYTDDTVLEKKSSRRNFSSFRLFRESSMNASLGEQENVAPGSDLSNHRVDISQNRDFDAPAFHPDAARDPPHHRLSSLGDSGHGSPAAVSEPDEDDHHAMNGADEFQEECHASTFSLHILTSPPTHHHITSPPTISQGTETTPTISSPHNKKIPVSPTMPSAGAALPPHPPVILSSPTTPSSVPHVPPTPNTTAPPPLYPATATAAAADIWQDEIRANYRRFEDEKLKLKQETPDGHEPTASPIPTSLRSKGTVWPSFGSSSSLLLLGRDWRE
jgi:hypothetical protein